MIKIISTQILLFFFTCTFGYTQTISIDSLDNYYNTTKLALQHKVNLQEVSLSQDVKNHPISEISEFSQLQNSFVLLAKLELSNEYELAVQLLSKIIPQTKAVDQLQAFLYLKLAHFYERKLRKPVPSLECYLKAATLMKNLEEHTYLAGINYRISVINLNGLNNRICIDYASEGLEQLKQSKSLKRSDSFTYLGLHEAKGIAFRRMHQFDQALDNIEEAIKFAELLNDTVRFVLNNGNKATIYYQQENYSQAIPLLKKDFETSINASEYNSGMNALVYLSSIYIKTNNQDSLDKIVETMKSIEKKYPITNPKTKTDYLEILAKVARKKGLIAEENKYLRDYVKHEKIRDSLNLNKEFSSLHERHILDQEVSKLELLQSTNQLQASHLKLRTALLAIIGLALLAVLWYVFTLRNKNKKIDRLNELLEAKVSERTTKLMEINKELDTYLYRASHDIRRPIRTLLGLNNIAQITPDYTEIKELFSKVHATAIGMDKMLYKLQMAYELNNSHEIEDVQLTELVKECLNDMRMEIDLHNANVSVDIKANATCVKASKELLRIAINNIIENALLYHDQEVVDIGISTDVGKQYFYIYIKDNGSGIEQIHFNNLFKPYFKISNKTQGSGLGLFLAHRAISYLGGEITLESIVNRGSHFTIKIPLNPK